MKPGKPLAFGHIGPTPLLGLPGNPVAAAVSFVIFGRPAIRTMLGHQVTEPRMVEVVTADGIDNRGQRRHYVRVRLEPAEGGPALARIAGEQGAGVLSSLAAADALMIVPEDDGARAARNALASDSARLVVLRVRTGSRKAARLFRATAYFSPRRITRCTNGEEAWCKDSALSTRCVPCWACYARSASTRFASKRRRPPRLLIVATTADEARRLGLAVTGPEGQSATIFRAVDEPIDSVGHVDAAVVWDPERTGAGSRVAEALRFESPPVPIVRFEGVWS